jgi:acetyl-CoA acetyltransferase
MKEVSMLGGRRVFVVGGGLHPYQGASDTSYVELGLIAVRRALTDARIEWSQVESAYVGTAQIGMAAGTTMLRYLGAPAIPVVQVDNASASGSTAFRQAVIEVAGGVSDVVLVVGVDKPDPRPGGRSKAKVSDLVGRLMPLAAHFALAAERYMRSTGTTAAQLAQVAVKNHRNGSLNPNAQRRAARTLAEVLAPPIVAGPLTRLQCAPRGEGAAAVLVMSEAGMKRCRVSRRGAAEVLASVHRTGNPSAGPGGEDRVTAAAAADAYEQAGIGPQDLDVIELHDAFTVEELLYLEAMGLCPEGEAAQLLTHGHFDIDGACAVSPSGGLLAMGHPIGPTGVGQIVELLAQLTGRAGPRQHPSARTGLAQLVGVGNVCLIHLLQS